MVSSTLSVLRVLRTLAPDGWSWLLLFSPRRYPNNVELAPHFVVPRPNALPNVREWTVHQEKLA